jgi:hypothetical protein
MCDTGRSEGSKLHVYMKFLRVLEASALGLIESRVNLYFSQSTGVSVR